MKTSVVDRINNNSCVSNALIDGLEKRAIAAGMTMAEKFRIEIKNSSAFNVYAKCTRVNGNTSYYTFKDGSTDTYYYQARKQ